MEINPNNLSVRQLRAFDAVAQKGSFIAAARHVHITPSALSESVAQLEESLGVRLFDRTTRRVALTHAGELFAREVSMILQRLHSAAQQVADMGSLKRGKVVLAGAPSVLARVVLPAVDALQRDHAIEVVLMEEGAQRIFELVQSGQADLGVGNAHAIAPDLLQKPLLQDRFGLVSLPSHPVQRKKRLVLQDLLAWEVVGLTSDTGIYRLLSRQPNMPAQLAQPSLSVSNPLLMRQIIESRNCIALIPALIAYHPAFAGAAYREVNDLSLQRPIVISSLRQRSLSPAAERLRALISQEAQALRGLRGVSVG